MSQEGCPLVPPKAPTESLQTATFALGWFWGPDIAYAKIPGVVRTRVGYTGGKKKDPSYYSLGDNTEAVQVEFDPTKITFDELLDLFWTSHDASRKGSIQYRSAIWFESEEQQQAIEKSVKYQSNLPRYRGRKIATHIAPLGDFYLAEDYHQKYLDRSLLKYPLY